MYQITHTYVTVDDDGIPVVETETETALDWTAITPTIDRMLMAPGGLSGSTVAISVTMAPTFSIKA